MRCMTVTFLGVLTLCAPVGVHADPAGDARRAIQAAYAARDAATAHKDAAGATASLAPGYSSTDTKGSMSDAAQERQAATQLFAQAQSAAAKTVLLSLTLDTPTQATVTERSHIVMVLPAPAQANKPLKVVLSGTARDIWIRTPQGWREKYDQALTETFTVNGKTMSAP